MKSNSANAGGRSDLRIRLEAVQEWWRVSQFYEDAARGPGAVHGHGDADESEVRGGHRSLRGDRGDRPGPVREELTERHRAAVPRRVRRRRRRALIGKAKRKRLSFGPRSAATRAGWTSRSFARRRWPIVNRSCPQQSTRSAGDRLCRQPASPVRRIPSRDCLIGDDRLHSVTSPILFQNRRAAGLRVGDCRGHALMHPLCVSSHWRRSASGSGIVRPRLGLPRARCGHLFSRCDDLRPLAARLACSLKPHGPGRGERAFDRLAAVIA
jgi:hypothetical protein